MRIKRNEYYIPSKVSHTAQLLIIKLLRPDPTTRPTVDEILLDDFFKGFTPNRLPISSLTMSPRFATTSSSNLLTARKPLVPLETNSGSQQAPLPEGKNGKIPVTSKRMSVGVRVIGGESVMVQPGEDPVEELKEEDGTVPCLMPI